MFVARKLLALRLAVIDFQHCQTEALGTSMKSRLETILYEMRQTEGEAVVLSAEEEVCLTSLHEFVQN